MVYILWRFSWHHKPEKWFCHDDLCIFWFVCLDYDKKWTLKDIGNDNKSISAASDEFTVVLEDIKTGDIIIVKVLVIFYQHVFWGVVQRNASVLWSSHTVFTSIIKFYSVNGSIVGFRKLLECGRKLRGLHYGYKLDREMVLGSII